MDRTCKKRAGLSIVASLIVSFAMSLIVASCASPRLDTGIFGQNKGKVMVVLLGMEGCPGTEAATPFLVEYSKSRPDGTVVYRVDVPPPGKKVERVGNLDRKLNYVVDNDRNIADRLEFFFYPTLFIIDKDGAVRFSGACEPANVRAIVAEIQSEAPGAKKKMYTPPLAGVGQVVDDFEVSEADNNNTSLAKLCSDTGALLFFSTTTCPFSVGALKDVEKIKKDFGDSKFKYVIVSFGQGTNEIGNVYGEKSPGNTVVIDADKKMSLTHFGVSAVPFMYVLDKNRKVLDRRPFQYDAAKAAVARALGKVSGSDCATPAASGAG